MLLTIEMKTTFLEAAGVPGRRLEARGYAYHQTLTMCFCEGELWLDEQLVARASGSFKFIRRHKARDIVANTPKAQSIRLDEV